VLLVNVLFEITAGQSATLTARPRTELPVAVLPSNVLLSMLIGPST
jgi:hypothetical protein